MECFRTAFAPDGACALLTLVQLLITLAACLGCGWLGDLLLKRDASAWVRVTIGTALGLGLASLLLLTLGVLQLWKPVLLQDIALAACMGGVVRAADLWRAEKAFQWPRRAEWLAALLLLFLFSVTLLLACSPVTDWDGLSYHLAVPKLYLQHGGIYWIPFIHHSNFPFATEMLFAPAVASHAAPAAKVVHWVFFLLASAGAGSVAARLFGRASAIWTALAFALMPVALWEAGAAYIDLSTAAYTLLSVIAFLTALDSDQQKLRWLAISALLAGMAAATKTFSLLWIALMVLWLIRSLWRAPGLLRAAGLFAGLAGLICIPWYVKSYILTGNPVYPFLYSVFGGKAWGAEGVEMYRVTFQKFGLGHGPLDFLRLPWDFAVNGGAFIDGGVIFGSPGVLFVALLPVAALSIKGRARPLALLTGFYLLAWFILSQQTRYLLPALGLGCVLLGSALARTDSAGKVARGACAVAGLVSVFLIAVAAQPVLPLLTGERSADSYILSQVNSYWVRDYLPPKAHVLLYREPRGFYLTQRYMWADANLSSLIPYAKFTSASQMIAWLKARGWQYAVINRRFGGSGRDLELWDEAIHQGLVRSPGDSAMAGGVELWEIL